MNARQMQASIRKAEKAAEKLASITQDVDVQALTEARDAAVERVREGQAEVDRLNGLLQIFAEKAAGMSAPATGMTRADARGRKKLELPEELFSKCAAISVKAVRSGEKAARAGAAGTPMSEIAGKWTQERTPLYSACYEWGTTQKHLA